MNSFLDNCPTSHTCVFWLSRIHPHHDSMEQVWSNLQKLAFVGYDNSTKGYKLWNPLSHKTVISTDVMFEESIFPLAPKSSHHTAEFCPRTSILSATWISWPSSTREQQWRQRQRHITTTTCTTPSCLSSTISESILTQTTPPAPSSAIRHSAQIPHHIQWPDPINVSPDQHQHYAAIRAWDNTAASYLSAVHVLPTGNPSTYEYAVKTLEANSWKTMMEEEMKCLRDNGTWGLTDLLEDRQAVKCRWVYLNKVWHTWWCHPLLCSSHCQGLFRKPLALTMKKLLLPSQDLTPWGYCYRLQQLRYGSAPYQHRIGPTSTEIWMRKSIWINWKASWYQNKNLRCAVSGKPYMA